MNGFSRYGSTPPVVKNLIYINVVLLLATLVLGSRFQIDLTEILGAHFFKSQLFEPYQIITYMFMHDPRNFLHIFFNMFALWMFGKVLENVWGSKRFLFYYLVTGIGAIVINMIVQYFELSHLHDVVASYSQSPNFDSFNSIINKYIDVKNQASELKNFIAKYSFDSSNPENIQYSVSILQQFYIEVLNTPTIGASGAVFGVLLAFGMLFPNTELMLLFPPIPIKAKWLVILYGVAELFLGVTQSASNVAHFAHLGGMIFGFFLIKYWNKKRTNFY